MSPGGLGVPPPLGNTFHETTLDSAASTQHRSGVEWSLLDDVIRQLQHAGAAEVDHGLRHLLQALLAATHARRVSCALLDVSPGRPPTTLVHEVAGLCTVDAALSSAMGMVTAEVEVRPGRRLVLQLSPGRVDALIQPEAIVARLGSLGRWLAWLDLSHGPSSSAGPMPRHHRRVLLLLLQGKSEKQIAAALGLSYNTAHQYVTALYRRYQVRNRGSLTALWLNPLC